MSPGAYGGVPLGVECALPGTLVIPALKTRIARWLLRMLGQLAR